VKYPNVVCVLISTDRGVFIGVQGVTDLIKSVTRQVVAGRPSHVASQPCGLTSTDFLHRFDVTPRFSQGNKNFRETFMHK
jgi:hypothetical protein